MESFEQILHQLHLSYLHARKNKRNTNGQLRFEINHETQLFELAVAIQKRRFKPLPCIAFIIQKPVMREIFASEFRDRIVHHLIFRCINPIIDLKLIADTYSCRKGKGTLYGIERVKHFMRSCSMDHSKETFFLKLDIEAYFMNMRHETIFSKVEALLPEEKMSYLGISRETLIFLLRQTIFDDVAGNCRIKGSREEWKVLPQTKSLFNYPSDTGVPIGNLTSQLFGNVYLNDFDHFVKKNLKIKHYGRYVDDMIFFHNDRDYLASIIPCLAEQLSTIGLKIHPKKIVLKSIDEGIPFLGQIIKPHRAYMGNRTKNNFFQAIKKINATLAVAPEISWKQMCDIRATLNSYLGIMHHANSFNLRKAMVGKLIGRFFDFFFVDDDFKCVIINHDFWEWHFSPSYRFTN